MKYLGKLLLLGAAPAALMSTASPVVAGDQEYIGELMLVGFNFCPRGSADASGQFLPISSYSALFSLYGTTYGGDGRTTFALPDLRGRAAISSGQGPGLSLRSMGERAGSETVTLTIANMPAHNHAGSQIWSDNSVIGDTGNPGGNAIARTASQIYSNNTPPAATGAMHPNSLFIQSQGNSQAVGTMNPYLVMRYCVVTEGIFPSRN